MTKDLEKSVVNRVNVARKAVLYSLINLENVCLELSDSLAEEYPELSQKLKNMAVSTIDNAIDDVCNGVGFILEDRGFPIKGQL